MTANTNIYTLDKRLLARMTGALGDPQTLGKICAELGQVFGEFLPDVLKSETGLDIAIAYAGFESGEKTALLRKLGDGVALSDCTLRNWCDFTISCDSPAISRSPKCCSARSRRRSRKVHPATSRPSSSRWRR